MRESGNPAAKYQMLAFTNTARRALWCWRPTASSAGSTASNAGVPLASAPGFTVMKIGSKQDMLKIMRTVHERDETPLGIYLGDGKFCVAVLKDKSLMQAAAPDKSEAWRTP